MWKLNTTLLQIDGIKEAFRQQWERLRSKQTWYRTKERWWEICAKSGIKRFFQIEGRERARTKKAQLEFYYMCIYDLLQTPSNFPELHVKLKYYKAKIIQLHSNQMQQLQAELRENVTAPDEQLSHHHQTTTTKKEPHHRNYGQK
jgi:hypothetical protein